MNFTQAVASGFRRYVDFNGRSTRSEFWWWMLFFYAVYTAWFLLLVIMSALGAGALYGVILAVGMLGWFGLFLPSLAVAIRRLHDTNRSGLLYLLVLTGIGGIVLLIWASEPGTVGENQYGPDSAAALGAPVASAQSTWAN